MNAIVEIINAGGRAFVDLALPMLVQSSLLILILLAADFVLRQKVRAVFRYWIWMLVLVKLVLPPSLGTPVSIGTWLGDNLEISVDTPSSELTAAAGTLQWLDPAEPDLVLVPHSFDRAASSGRPDTPPEMTWQPSLSVETMPAQPGDPPQQENPIPANVTTLATARAQVVALTWQGLALLLWAAIATALLLLLIQRAFFVRGLVRQAQDADPEMLDVLEKCRVPLRLRPPVAMKISPSVDSPAVCGLVRPTVLIPQTVAPKLGLNDLKVILLHELAHIGRGDLWVNLAQTLVQIVYFYNPLLWLANTMIRRAREQVVDETVLVAMGDTAAQYPETLVNIAKLAFQRRPALSLRLIGVVESKSALAARIRHILGRPLPKTAKLGITGLVTVVILAAVLLPMAKGQRESAGAIESRFALLPDCRVWMSDVDGRDLPVLDLASGEVIHLSAVKSEHELLKTLEANGEGDILYYYDRAKELAKITFLRSAGLQGEPVSDEYKMVTIIPQEMPFETTVATQGGDRFTIRILRADPKACYIQFRSLGDMTGPVAMGKPDGLSFTDAEASGFASLQVDPRRGKTLRVSYWSEGVDLDSGLEVPLQSLWPSGVDIRFVTELDSGNRTEEFVVAEIGYRQIDDNSLRRILTLDSQDIGGATAELLERLDELTSSEAVMNGFHVEKLPTFFAVLSDGVIVSSARAGADGGFSDAHQGLALICIRQANSRDVEIEHWCGRPPQEPSVEGAAVSMRHAVPRAAGVTVEGQVIGPDGAPLPKAPLSLTTAGEFGLVVNALRAITDESGRFRIGQVPSGTHLLYYPWSGPTRGDIDSGRWRAYHRPDERWPSVPVKDVLGAAIVEVDEGQTRSDVLIDLSKSTCTVEGQVRDVAGRLVAGAEVDLFWKLPNAHGPWMGEGHSAALTDSDGRYRLANLPPGRWHINAHHSDLKRRGELIPVTLVQGRVIGRDIRLPESVVSDAAIPGGTESVQGRQRNPPDVDLEGAAPESPSQVLPSPPISGHDVRPDFADPTGLVAELANGVTVEPLAYSRLDRAGLEWWTPQGRRTTIPGVYEADVEGHGNLLALRMKPEPEASVLAWSYQPPDIRDTLKPVWRVNDSNIWLVSLGEGRSYVNVEIKAQVRDPVVVIPVRMKRPFSPGGSETGRYGIGITDVESVDPDSTVFSVRGGPSGATVVAALDTSGRVHSVRLQPRAFPELDYPSMPQRYRTDVPFDRFAGIVIEGYSERAGTVKYRNLSLLPGRPTEVRVEVAAEELGPWWHPGESRQELEGLGSVLSHFADRGGGQYPADLADVQDFFNDTHRAWQQKHLVYLGAGKSATEAHAVPLAYQKTLLPFGFGTYVLFSGREVSFQTPDELEKLGIASKEAGPSEKGTSGAQRIYLPDLETPGADTVLDLATGTLLSGTPMEKDRRYFEKLGKGDVVYEYASGKSGLMCLRGATVLTMSIRQSGDWQAMEVTQPDVRRSGFVVYFIKQVPCRYLLETAEGNKYELSVISITKGDREGALVEFSQVDADGAVPAVDVLANMRQLALCVILFAHDHDGDLPLTLAAVEPYVSDRTQFVWMRANVTYVGKGNVKRATKPYAVPIAYKKTPEATGGTYVAFMDGHVALLPADRREALGLETAASDRPVGAEDWRDAGEEIPPDANDARTLAPGIRLDGIGQDVEGRVFLSCIRDVRMAGGRPCRFRLHRKDGQVLEPMYHTSLERDGGETLWEKFTFDMWYDHRQIDHFRLQSRPATHASGPEISSPREAIVAAMAAGEGPVPSKDGPPGRYALSFDGKGDYLLIPDSESLRAPSALTVDLWIKPRFPEGSLENRPGWAVLAKGAYTGTGHVRVQGFGIAMDNVDRDAGTIVLNHCESSSGSINVVGKGVRFPQDWIHIAETFHRSGYIPAPGHPLVIGRFLIPSEGHFQGEIAEIRLWDGGIVGRYDTGRYAGQALTGNEPGLLACWTFEQGGGRIAYDLSPNANHARLGRSVEADDADPAWVDLRQGEKLIAGELAGQVVDPNGNPAAEAQVAIITDKVGVMIRHGRLEQSWHNRDEKREIVVTDTQGRFQFESEPNDAFSLVAAHDAGFALVGSGEFVRGREVPLERWGRIEGQLAEGRRAQGNQIGMSGLPNSTWLKHGREYRYDTHCDVEGRFTFEKVPAGWFEVGYLTKTGETFSSVTSRTPVEVKPGETAHVRLGGEGRPVLGRFVPPAGYSGTVYFGAGLRALSTERPESPKPENYDRMTKRQQQQWRREWRTTPEAQAFSDAIWHDPNWRHYAFRIRPDGTFRIEDVIAGRYDLTVFLEERYTGDGPPDEIGGYSGTVVVPKIVADRADEPLDLGDLRLKMYAKPLRVGEVAPAFEATTLDGRKVRLAGYRGKFVLLSFWMPEFHPELDRLKALHETYGGAGKLQIIGFGGGDTLEEVSKYVAEHAIPWPQIYFGAEWDEGIARPYALPGLPHIMLIDWEGKILATRLRGEALTEAVEKAIPKTTQVPPQKAQFRVSGPVVDPNGYPAAGAQVAVGMDGPLDLGAPMLDIHRL